MDNYLIKYLVDTADNELSKKYIDFFKAELDWQMYVSETHIAEAYYRNRAIDMNEKLKRLYQYINALLMKSRVNQPNNVKILSTLKLPQKEVNSLSQIGFDSYSPIWHPLRKKNIFGDYKTLKWCKNIQDRIRNDDFHLFLDSKFHNALEIFQQYLLAQYQEQDFRALFLYTDQYFYSKYSIDIFKKMNRPSFVFSHGMPGLYSKEVDNRSDYLMVWSEKIRKNYIDVGFEPSKVKVVGHPIYKKLEKEKTLRSDLSDILIIPVSSVTWHQHTYNKPVVNDASMVVLYLYKVQKVLMRLGIKKARYRPHPSINKKWMYPFLDSDFYVLDSEALTTSLNKSSLVIGANSTVVLEALMQGVNYIAFDPKDKDGVNMSGYKAVPPFDGSEEKLMMAEDEFELEKMIKANVMTDYTIVHDFIQEFDLTVLKDLIN
ncbi:MAG: hypothetical protein ACJAX3_000880 [Patiriisocius sp.]|jgi:hypothetical protein